MVKKLFKHEFLAWLRIMPLIYGIVLVVAAMNRLIFCFETDTVYFNIIRFSGLFMYVVGLMVCLATPSVFAVVRFYKNLFTGEGYLTFTLPVSNTVHLWVKPITALCFSVASLLVTLLTIPVITAGEVFKEVMLAAEYLLKHIPDDIVWHLVGWCAEGFVAIILALYASHLLFAACICVGQTFRKNRILAAVGAYFVYYIFTQVCGTVFAILSVVLAQSELMISISNFIIDHPYATMHIGFSFGIVVYGVLAAVFFLISRYVIRKRLNLE